MTLKAPFPYFGGKARIAPLVWRAFGDVRSYVEPFAGSLAVLLARPEPFRGAETINDADGMVANFWRAMTRDPDAVADAAEWPVNEIDLMARHLWLVGQRERITERLMADPDWCDPKAAGWWVWGLCCWIGSGWCSGKGPWQLRDGEVVDARQLPHLGDEGQGVNRKRPHLGDEGRGVNRKRPHLANEGQGVNRKRPHLANEGQGVNRQRPHLGNEGRGPAHYWLGTLADRLRRVRVCCGDWSRVCTPSVLFPNANTVGALLDPPYPSKDRCPGLYTIDDTDVAHAVREWCAEHGNDPRYRIALCGYEGEHNLPGWSEIVWEQGRCYAKSAGHDENSARERLWLSPHCRPVDGLSVVHKDRQTTMFAETDQPAACGAKGETQ